jgi:type I restriction enzyme, R subunit
MNEAETRAELIDPALAAAGWGVVEGSRIRREYLISPGRIEGRGRRGKPLILPVGSVPRIVAFGSAVAG